MEGEKGQLKKYGVYEELDQLPPGKQTVDTKWVLREKFDQAGKLQKRKVRLTARGFTQVYGLHCDDLTAPAKGEEIIDCKPYQRLIGSLSYIAQSTRPDILYAVSYLARRNSQATSRHWEAALRIVRFLFSTAYNGLKLSATTPSSGLTIWVDASYGGDEEGRCQMGILTCIGDTAVGWASQRQKVVALSSTEAEYIALSAGAQHAAWMKEFLAELGEVTIPVIITDNDGARKLSENPGFHKKTKHIHQRYHYIRQQLELGELTIEWKAGKYNKADLLTKVLPAPTLTRAASAAMDGYTLTPNRPPKDTTPDEHLSKGEC
jgi:hypothetical protein